MGGSKENRNAVAYDHWSIAVKDGKALDQWREEVPIPRGGPHRFFNTCSNHTSFCFEPPSMLLIIMGLIWFCRACVVANDKLLVIGGQEGDFMAKPNSPIFKCSRRREVFTLLFFFLQYPTLMYPQTVPNVWSHFQFFNGEVYMMDEGMKWKMLPPMPKNNSHIESAWIIVNNSIVIVGGTTDWHPVTKRLVLVGEIFRFQLDTLVSIMLSLVTFFFSSGSLNLNVFLFICLIKNSQTWSVIGRLPYRVKTAMAGYWNGYLYFTSGQRDRGPDNPQPGKVIGEMWRTKLKF